LPGVRHPRARGAAVGAASTLRRALATLALGVLFTATTAAAQEASDPFAGGPIPKNSGGVLILHLASNDAWQADSTDFGRRLAPSSREGVVTRVPTDDVPRLVVLYALFPPDSAALVMGATFGIKYSPGVRVTAQGPCRGVSLTYPDPKWPASGGGNVTAFNPAQILAAGEWLPVYWFALASASPGYFEVAPNPSFNLGGKFGNAEALPHLESIVGYGRIVFGAEGEGTVPAPGERLERGACCTKLGCWPDLSRLECEYYRGTYLGPQASCQDFPCDEDAIKTACCLPDGSCEMLRIPDCVKAGGVSRGRGLACDAVPCAAIRDSVDTVTSRWGTPRVRAGEE